MEKINAQLEREAFMDYVEAVAERCPSGHSATVVERRRHCPDEYRAWREAFARAYQHRMSPERFAESVGDDPE